MRSLGDREGGILAGGENGLPAGPPWKLGMPLCSDIGVGGKDGCVLAGRTWTKSDIC